MAKDAKGHGSERRVAGASIERERDGTYSVYRSGNPYATTGGFKSSDEAAAAALGEGNPKASAAPVHSAMGAGVGSGGRPQDFKFRIGGKTVKVRANNKADALIKAQAKYGN